MLICSSLMLPRSVACRPVASSRIVRMTTNTCFSKRSTFGRCGTLSTSSRASGWSPSRSPRRATRVGSPRPSMLIQVTALWPRRASASSSVATFCISALVRSKVVTSIVGISADTPATRVPGGVPGWMRAVRPRWGSRARPRCCLALRLMRASCSGSPRGMSRRQAYARVSEGMASMPSRGLVLATAAVTFLVFSPCSVAASSTGTTIAACSATTGSAASTRRICTGCSRPHCSDTTRR